MRIVNKERIAERKKAIAERKKAFEETYPYLIKDYAKCKANPYKTDFIKSLEYLARNSHNITVTIYDGEWKKCSGVLKYVEPFHDSNCENCEDDFEDCVSFCVDTNEPILRGFTFHFDDIAYSNISAIVSHDCRKNVTYLDYCSKDCYEKAERYTIGLDQKTLDEYPSANPC